MVRHVGVARYGASVPSHDLPLLALELNVSQMRIRDFIAEIPGVVVAGDSFPITAPIVNAVRAHFGDPASRPLTWVLEPGDTVRRRAIHAAYGGSSQSGISTPRRIPEIHIFTSPESGALYGYDAFEGLREDGSYAYTGEGQRGDQVFKRGNAALLNSTQNGKIIRVMRKSGVYATYVGAFETDNPVFARETIPDVDGNPRSGIIFNLLPVEARTELLPVYGGPVDPIARAIIGDWIPPDFSDIDVPVSETSQGSRTVSRTEFELQSAFGLWATGISAEPKRLQLRSWSGVIEPDMYLPSHSWIIEAKRSTSRRDVRMAIGQVLDYVHVAESAGISARPVILLPGLPEPDLIDLTTKLEILIAVRTAGGFDLLGVTG